MIYIKKNSFSAPRHPTKKSLCQRRSRQERWRDALRDDCPEGRAPGERRVLVGEFSEERKKAGKKEGESEKREQQRLFSPTRLSLPSFFLSLPHNEPQKTNQKNRSPRTTARPSCPPTTKRPTLSTPSPRRRRPTERPSSTLEARTRTRATICLCPGKGGHTPYVFIGPKRS